MYETGTKHESSYPIKETKIYNYRDYDFASDRSQSKRIDNET